MTAYTSTSSDFTMTEDTEVRGIGGLRPVRITRTADGVSALLHKIPFDSNWMLYGRELTSPLPDFGQPFVTKIYGPVSTHCGRCLVEPLPPCVPLAEIWYTTLTEAPLSTPSVLRVILRQTRNATQSYAHKEERSYGAVCVENVVLTADGIYGLLQASVGSGDDCVWLRPANTGAVQWSPNNELDDDIAIIHMARRLIDQAFALKNLPHEVETELRSILSRACR